MSKHWLLRPLTRRQFIGLGILANIGAILGSFWIGNLYKTAHFEKLDVKRIDIKSSRWPSNYKKLKIAFLTDLHVGCMSVNLSKLKKIVEQVNALNADIILLGGDYLTTSAESVFKKYIEPSIIAAVLSDLRARLGVYSVLGNHDWVNDGIGMWNALEVNNIKVLENDAVFVENENNGFWIVGLADYLTRLPNYRKAMKKASSDRPKIVLSHDPITFRDCIGDPVIQLSGHTHGGQVRLPFVGAVASPTPSIPRRWMYGLAEDNNHKLLVSSGVGTSILPIKNTPNEVILLTVSSGLEPSSQNG
jgi:predicted MPP superfamily phosphohydrolase